MNLNTPKLRSPSESFQIFQNKNILELSIQTVDRIAELLGFAITMDASTIGELPYQSILIHILGDGFSYKKMIVACNDRIYVSMNRRELDRLKIALNGLNYQVAIVPKRSPSLKP